MVWSPLAGGLLSGKFGPGSAAPNDARRANFDFPPVDKDRAWACIAAMREIGEAHGVSVARVALAWLLAKPQVMSVIIGAKTVEQLDDNLAAVEPCSDAGGDRQARCGQRPAGGISRVDAGAPGRSAPAQTVHAGRLKLIGAACSMCRF